MKKFLLKIAYRYLIKQSYDFLPYFYCGEVYETVNAKSSHDTKNQKSVLVVTCERKW